MIKDKKMFIVMPAYNSGKTIGKTIESTPKEYVDVIILVDDGSKDDTFKIAQRLGLHVLRHNKNKGYGEALKTGFQEALRLGADIVVVLHSDNQYEPSLVNKMAVIIADGSADVVMASRLLDRDVVRKMPFYRYVANRILTLSQNIVFRADLSEYQSGYRAYSTDVLKSVDYLKNSGTFVFDNELLAQIFFKGSRISEIPCPAKYDEDTSSISISGSFKYFIRVLNVATRYFLHKMKLKKYIILDI